MFTPTQSSFRNHVQPIQNQTELPPFSLPTSQGNHAQFMSPTEALAQLGDSQAGFIGGKVACLVANAL